MNALRNPRRRYVWMLLGWLALTAPAIAQFPDLTVERIVVNPPNPAPGQDATVTVYVRNIGSAIPAADTLVYLWHNATSPMPCSFDDFESLGIAFPTGTERLFTFTVSYPTVGTYELWAWVDGCEPLIPELDENNNTLGRSVTVGLGDLLIDRIEQVPADAVPGQPVMIDVTVRNNGPSMTNQIWSVGIAQQQSAPVTCALDANLGPFQGFAANASQTFQFGPYTYNAGGDYPVWAFVDCADSALEADENNNRLLGTVSVSRPDLIVESITPSVATPRVGIAYDIDVTVRNVGAAPAEAFRVSLEPDAQPATETYCPVPDFQMVNALAPQAATTLTFAVTHNQARQYNLVAAADSCHALSEAREDNNTQALPLNVSNPVGGAPDLVIESVVATEIPMPGVGNVMVLDVLVRNAGTAPAGAFRVGDFNPTNFPGTYPAAGLVMYGTPGPQSGGSAVSAGTAQLYSSCEWRSRAAGPLPVGAATTVTFWRQHFQGGTFSFGAYADVCGSQSWQRVPESSEDNNALVIEYVASGCSADADLDGVCDEEDLCPNTPDPRNNDSDGDGMGDVCDNDDDNDGVADANDCDPRNPFVFPGATDCPDGVDNDCDGQMDEDAVQQYRDADGDGFGDPAEPLESCQVRAGYVSNRDDCDDTNARVYPGANGPCDDGLDNDCDGTIDNEETVWGRDEDGDGFTEAGTEITRGNTCNRPTGYTLASATPDPDDTDFMVPEPVVVDQQEVRWSTPAGRVNEAVVRLSRNGPEPYTYEASFDLPVDGFARLAPGIGTAVNGLAELTLTPQVDGLALASYETTLDIVINGVPAFSLPVRLDLREPVLRVVHRGQTFDGGVFDWDYFDNAAGQSSPPVEFVSRNNETYAVEVPTGEGIYLYAYQFDDCGIFNGFFDEADQPLPELRFETGGGKYGPVIMDGDRTVYADFSPDYLSCGVCSATLFMTCFLGLRWTHPNRRRRLR